MQARRTCHERDVSGVLRQSRTSQALVVPSAAECFENIDLKLDQAGITGGDRLIEGREGLFGGEPTLNKHLEGARTRRNSLSVMLRRQERRDFDSQIALRRELFRVDGSRSVLRADRPDHPVSSASNPEDAHAP